MPIQPRGLSMSRPGRCIASRAAAARTAAHLALCLFGFLSGCQVPAARVSYTDSDGILRSPTCLLARQVVADTAVQLVCHPFHTGKIMLTEPVGHLRAAGRGIVGKRIIMPLAPEPGPLFEDRVPLSAAALEDGMRDL